MYSAMPMYSEIKMSILKMEILISENSISIDCVERDCFDLIFYKTISWNVSDAPS